MLKIIDETNDALLGKAGVEFEDFRLEDEDQTTEGQHETAYGDGPQLDRDEDVEDNYCKTKEQFPEGSSDDGSLGEIDAGTIDFTAIKPREWLLGNTFCRQFFSSLISAGGIGKTALRIVQGLALATRRNLTGEHVFRRCRVLIVTAEDDLEELKRRVGAAMLHYGISREDAAGWLLLRAISGLGWKLAISAKGEVQRKELAARIENSIINSKLDIVILDQFVKTHGVPENDNNAIDQVAGILADIAIRHNVAIDVPHHASKATTDPGDPNKARGASSFIDGGRLSYTLTAMSGVEAQVFGISEEERRSLVRVDSAKVNLVRARQRPNGSASSR